MKDEILIMLANQNYIIIFGDMVEKLLISQLSKDPYYKDEMEFDGEKYMEDILCNENKDCFIYVEEVNNEIVGFIEIWLRNSDFYFFADKYAYIMHYYIEEKNRNTTQIYKMINKLYYVAEKCAKENGYNYICADVFSHNDKIITLLKPKRMEVYRYRTAKQLGNLAK